MLWAGACRAGTGRGGACGAVGGVRRVVGGTCNAVGGGCRAGTGRGLRSCGRGPEALWVGLPRSGEAGAGRVELWAGLPGLGPIGAGRSGLWARRSGGAIRAVGGVHPPVAARGGAWHRKCARSMYQWLLAVLRALRDAARQAPAPALTPAPRPDPPPRKKPPPRSAHPAAPPACAPSAAPPLGPAGVRTPPELPVWVWEIPDKSQLFTWLWVAGIPHQPVRRAGRGGDCGSQIVPVNPRCGGGCGCQVFPINPLTSFPSHPHRAGFKRRQRVEL